MRYAYDNAVIIIGKLRPETKTHRKACKIQFTKGYNQITILYHIVFL